MIKKITLNLLFRFLLIFTLSLTACDNGFHEKFIGSFRDVSQPELEEVATNYIIHWPAIYHKPKRGAESTIDRIADPVTLKIPKQWLDEKPYLIQNGKITSLYFVFSIPGPKPFINLPQAYKSDLPEVKARYLENWKTRVFVVLHRDEVFRLRDKTQYLNCNGKTNCIREPDIAGLERYTSISCYSPDELKRAPVYQNNIRRKAADDSTPKGCVLNRGEQYLVTTLQTPKGQEVDIICTSTHCEANFMAGKRHATVFVSQENIYYHTDKLPRNPLLSEIYTDLPNWREKVEVARKLIDEFLVNK